MKISRDVRFVISQKEIGALFGVRVDRIVNVEWAPSDVPGERALSVTVAVEEDISLKEAGPRLRALEAPKKK